MLLSSALGAAWKVGRSSERNMNFELGEIKSSSRAAAVFNRNGSSVGNSGGGGGGGSQSINFPNVRINNRFLDDGDKLHSDLVGLSVAARRPNVEDIYEEEAGAAEEGHPEGAKAEEAEPPMEVEDLEHLGEQEVFSLVARKPNEVQRRNAVAVLCRPSLVFQVP